jgi:hypothetical protein
MQSQFIKRPSGLSCSLGEIALERLQKAITKRTKEKDNISNRYELTSLITNSLNKNYISKLKLGDTKLLFNYLKYSERISTSKFSDYLTKINQSEKETISDQLFTMIISDSYNRSPKDFKLTNYFKRSLGDTKDISGFESFVKAWIVLEKAVSFIHLENNRYHKKFVTAKFEPLASDGLITAEEAVELNYFKRVRNNLLHGTDILGNQELNNGFIRLIDLTEKVVACIKIEKERSYLLKEINFLRN